MRSDTEFYPTLPNISLRDEFERLLRGDVGVVGIGRPVILRRLTNDKCGCWDDKTGGPLYYCSYCLGEGFTFTEERDLAYIADGTAPLLRKFSLFGCFGLFPPSSPQRLPPPFWKLAAGIRREQWAQNRCWRGLEPESEVAQGFSDPSRA